MTKNEKMQQLVEASGGCWHEYQEPFKSPLEYSHCVKCGALVWTRGTSKEFGGYVNQNPSPDSVDDLLAIAERLEFKYIEINYITLDGDWLVSIQTEFPRDLIFNGHGDTPAEALLEALWQTIGGE